ncbi:MAG: hypothetical protein Q4B54_04755 [Coriobacteriales bacterium]|nr:hypothetical protein [Coriobacteriales bacterium]
MGKIVDKAKAVEQAKKVMNSYRSDLWFRAEASVYMSCGVNVTYSMYQALIGLTRKSAWFDALAIYYILLTLTRVLMLHYIRHEAEDGREELRRYRKCGAMMLVLTLPVLVIGLLLNNGGSAAKEYPGHMVFVVGVFTLYTLVMSARNLWVYRKLESPLISASKSVNLAASLVSLYAFQAALFAEFRTIIRPSVITLFNVLTAAAASILVFYMSMHIIVRASRALRGKEDIYIVVDEAKTSYQKEFRSDVSSWISAAGNNANLPDWAKEMSDFSDRYKNE